MKVTRPIAAPIPGERVLAVLPPLSPYVAQPARGRMSPFTGRALTHTALTAQQRGRASEVARVARTVAPGVIEGLEVAISGRDLHILPGRALTPDGEDIELHANLLVAADDLPVDGDGLAARLPDDDALRPRLAGGEALTLADLREAGRLDLLPRAFVLTAVPVSVAIDRTGERDDPCANATGEVAQSDLAWEDGFRLIWTPWPLDRFLPGWTEDGTGVSPRFRNRLAYAIFDAEVAGAPDWPWTARGAPLALVGLDADHRPAFADRAAVVRQGGGPRNRSGLVPGGGDDVLWQARVAQALEHLAELPPEERAADRLPAQFDRLPPATFLPRAAADFDAARQFVLPATFDVAALPVPLDTVDALVAESARLAPIDLSLPGVAQMLVPVPAASYDPDLLDLAPPLNPLFDGEVLRLEAVRSGLLLEQTNGRRRFDLLSRGITGRIPGWPLDDRDALPDEAASPGVARSHGGPVAAGQSIVHEFSKAAPLSLAPGETLFVWVRADAAPASLTLRATVTGGTVPPVAWGSSGLEGAVDAGAVPAAGRWVRLELPVAAGLGGKTVTGLAFGVNAGEADAAVLWGPAGKRGAEETVWFDGALPPGAVASGEWRWTGDPPADAPEQGLTFGGNVALLTELGTLAATYRAFNNGVLAPELGEGATANPRPADAGLDELIARLTRRIAAADDHIEFGFLRARSDIYRIRQSVLGVEEAGRLLTAPAAAELIKRNESPAMTDREFADYFKQATSRTVPTVAPERTSDPAPEAENSGTFFGPSVPAAALARNTRRSLDRTVGVSILTASRPVTALVARPAGLADVPVTAAIRPVDVFADPDATAFGRVEKSAGVDAFASKRVADTAAAIPAGEVAVGPANGLLGQVRPGPTVDDVANSSLFGATVNSVTVGERLAGAPAVVAKNAAAKGKSDFVVTGAGLLADAGLAIDDLPVFGFAPKTGAGPVTAGGLRADAAQFVDRDMDEPEDQHESSYFKRGLDAVDNMIRFLRGVEVRAEDYRRLQADAVAARARMLAARAAVSAQLDRIAADLAEARHDLAAARALRAEEEGRLAALAARRRRILAEEVPFLVLRRPLVTDPAVDAPRLAAQAALAADPLPACRAHHGPVPVELQAMVDTLRDVPARWFKRVHPLIDRFDRIELIDRLLGASATRLAKSDTPAPPTGVQPAVMGKAEAPLATTYARQGVRVAAVRNEAAVALTAIKTTTWREAALAAKAVVAVSDLLVSPLRPVTLEAAGELDDIAGVATCLHQAFSGTPAALRLRWVEAFSEHDDPPSLRLLSVLPGFDAIEWEERRRMQTLVDWLYGRIEPVEEALGAIDDLVRVALLLAAHAPVRRIVSARVRRPAPNRPGVRLDLLLDPSLTHIGMEVLVHGGVRSGLPISRAVVEDLTPAGAVARILHADAKTPAIDADARVVLGAGLSFTAAASRPEREVRAGSAAR